MTQGPTRLIVLALAGLTVLLTTSCGDTAEPAAQETPSPTPSTTSKPYTVEQLAATVGCTPRFHGKTKDFREARCTVGEDEFVLLDFDTAEGQRAWLDTATRYGGVFLAGERWALSGRSEEYLEQLRDTLGGTIEERTP